MDIRELRHILAIADGGTLTRAAEMLHVSRRAVAKTLRSAEVEVGAPLFERRNAALIPTERGDALIKGARPITATFDELCRVNLRHPSGAPAKPDGVRAALSIALVTGGREALPHGLLERYSALHPHVALDVEEMSTDAVFDEVRRGGANIGIVGTHPELAGEFDRLCVRRVGVWLYVPEGHPMAGREKVALTDLDGLAMVTAGRHNHVHRFVMLRCAEAGVRPDIRATTTDTTLLGHLVSEHNAACFGFPPDVQAPPAGSATVRLAIEGGDEFGTYLIRRPAGKGPVPSAAARQFWSIGQALAKQIGAEGAASH